ncbi:MAG: SDR family NAD(P)-dependent oxidoreductase [Janthinobacterium lividum]
MDARFDNEIVLVTGAAQGNGAAIARGFAEAGAQVLVVDRNMSGARATAVAIVEAGGRAQAYELDVADDKACAALAAKVSGEVGDVSVLVNNAGILIRARLDEGDPIQSWRATQGVNLSGPYFMTVAFLEALKRRNGCILNVGSIQSFVATPNSAPYTASKGGVAQLTKALACELAEFGIRVNAIAPGVIETPMTVTTMQDPVKLAGLLAHVPMRRPGQADELIGPARFLCSRQASYVTGAILPVDGGYLAC